MRRSLSTLTLSAVLLAPAAAVAQPGSSAPPPGAGLVTPASAFATLDRGDDHSRLGVDAGWLHVEDSHLNEGGLRVDVTGQFIDPRSRLGGYFVLPLNSIINSPDSHTAPGDIEGGMLAVLPLGPNDLLILRGGATLPTAGDGLDDVVTNVIGSYVRLTDLVQFLPKTVSLRASASWLGHRGQLFYRADGGIDQPVVDTSDAFDLERDPLLRLNLGLGIAHNTFTGAVELVNLVSTTSTQGSDHEVSSAGVTGSLAIGQTGRLHAGAYLTLDSLYESGTNQALWVFMVGSSWLL